MEENSKRDIYDLIAELAKSTNLNVEVPQNTSDNKVLRKKPVSAKLNQDNSNQINIELTEKKPNINNQEFGTHSNLLQQLNEAKAASIEELTKYKVAVLAEINKAKTAFVFKNYPEPATVTAQMPDLSNFESINSSEHASLIKPTNSNQTKSIGQENKKSSNTLLEELHRLKALEQQNKIDNKAEQQKKSSSSLSIEELNLITKKSIKELENQQALQKFQAHSAADSLVIQDQLKKINEKIDSLSVKNNQSDVLKDKIIDERILYHVNEARQTIVEDLSKKKNETLRKPTKSFTTWVGLLNLVLVIGVLLYLLLTKFNQPVGVSAEHAKSSSSALESSQHFVNSDVSNGANESNINANEIENQQSNTKEIGPLNNKSSSINYSRNTQFTNSNALNNKQKPSKIINKKGHASRAMGSNSLNNKSLQEFTNEQDKYKNQKNDELVKFEAIKKEPQLKNRTEISKKEESTKDVYFGED